MNRKTHSNNTSWVLSFLLILGGLGSCETNKEKSDDSFSIHVYDRADFLIKKEEDMLDHYFDSLELNTGWRFVYSSIDNFERGNFDSLARNEFIQFPLAENGALFFLSRGDATVKILVGKKPHSLITDGEISRITEELLDYFRTGHFYEGLKVGSLKMIDLGNRGKFNNLSN